MPYDFSADWFSPHIPIWQRHLAPLRERADVRYLEVGVYEGRSFFWTLEHILTGPNARATAVDAFFAHEPDYEATFRKNLAKSPQRDRVDVLKGDSADVLRSLPLGSYDLAYIDAGHGQRALYIDLALTWGILAEGGLLVLDDYRMSVGRLPDSLRPQPVIDTFLSAVALEVEIVHSDYQVILRKVPSRSAPASHDLPPYMRDTCTALGDWYYFWYDQSLVRADGSDTLDVPLRLRKPLEWALRNNRGPLVASLLTRLLALRRRRN